MTHQPGVYVPLRALFLVVLVRIVRAELVMDQTEQICE